MAKVNVAVIGIGNMGQHYLRNYFKIPQVNLVAICDTNREKEKLAKKYNCLFYRDYKKMLIEQKIDAISITLPTFLHCHVACDVLKRRINLLIEKPIATNLTEAKKIIKEAKKQNVKLMIGHVERFNPAVQKFKKIIKEGRIGNITSIIIRRVGIFTPHPVGETNVVMGLAIHDIDVLNYLLDKQPTEVFAKGRNILTKRGEDSAEIILSYNEINSFIQLNWITPGKIRTMSATGLKGYAELNYFTQKLEVYKANLKKKISNFKEFIKLGQPVKKEIKIQKKEPLFCELESFIECVRKNTKPQVTGEDGLNNLIVVEKTIESLKYNKVIKI